MDAVSATQVRDIPLALTDPPPDADRIDINPVDVDELAQSIQELGQLQAILVRPIGDRYEIVFGHRRYLACKQLSRDVLRAEIRPMTDKEAAVIRGVENLQRVDLTPIEEAQVYGRLRDLYNMTFEEIGLKMKKNAGTVKRRLDLLKMPPSLQTAVHKKTISISVAEELWSIRDNASLEYYLMFAVENGCTKEVARGWAKEWKDTQRRDAAAGVAAPSPLSPYEPRPYYLTCDFCHQPVLLGDEKQVIICPECYRQIKNALGGQS